MHGTMTRPRLFVFRSNQNIYVQLVNDDNAKILMSASDKELKAKKGEKKSNLAKEVGKLIAKKAIEANEFNVKAYINLGAVYEKEGSYKKAISALKNAVELNPKNAKAYFNLAIVCEKEKDFKNAVIAYSMAAELNHEKKEEIAKKINELKNLITDIGYSYSVGMQ